MWCVVVLCLLLFRVVRSLFVVRCLSAVICYLLFHVFVFVGCRCCVLLVIGCWLFVVRCSLFGVRCLLLIIEP